MNRYPIGRGCPSLDHEVNLEVDGKYYTCCHTTDYKFDTLEELTKWQKEQKETFKKGLWPSACHVCKKREHDTNNVYSLRIDQFEKVRGYNVHNSFHQFRYVGMSLKNLCNYTCFICGPYSSQMIYDAKKEFAEIPNNWDGIHEKMIKSPQQSIDELLKHKHTLKSVMLLGGEPFLIKEYISFLRELPKTVRISLVTNASIYNKDFIEELKKFDEVGFNFSVDGYGEINDATRLNSNWKNIENNIKKIMKEIPYGFFNICPTWSNLTIAHWKSLYDWGTDLGLIANNLEFFNNIVIRPNHLKLCYMSQPNKRKIIKSLKGTKVKNVAVNLNETDYIPDDIKKQLMIIKDIGKQKGFDYDKLFPHVYQELH